MCRVAKEVWRLAPTAMETGDFIPISDRLHNLKELFSFIPKKKQYISLIPFIGWNLWKARNALLFQNKREHITEIISKAINDYCLWKKAQEISDHDQLFTKQHRCLYQVLLLFPLFQHH